MSSNPDTGSAGSPAKPASFVKSLGSVIRKAFRSRKRHEDYPPLEAEKGFFVNEAEYRQALAQKAPGRTTLQAKDGLRITIRRNLWDARIVREIFFERPYIQDCRIPEHAVIVDIGGYIGDFPLYCAKYCQASRVIVYEPTLENYNVLCENVRQNGFQGLIEPVNKAVGRPGELVLNVQKLSEDEFHVSAYWYEGCEKRSVPSISVAELYATHKLDHVDLLKIDCEGGEYDILPTNPDPVLACTQNIVFEFHVVDGYEPKLNLARERLRAAGFVLHQDGIIISACRS
jgi:FkbM family methyltransferase